jgi:hypothetical protein
MFSLILLWHLEIFQNLTRKKFINIQLVCKHNMNRTEAVSLRTPSRLVIECSVFRVCAVERSGRQLAVLMQLMLTTDVKISKTNCN